MIRVGQRYESKGGMIWLVQSAHPQAGWNVSFVFPDGRTGEGLLYNHQFTNLKLIADAPGESTVSPAGKLAQLNERMQAAARAHSAGHLTDELYEAFRKKILAEMEAPETIPAPKETLESEPGQERVALPVYSQERSQERNPSCRAEAPKSAASTYGDRLGYLTAELAESRARNAAFAAYLGPTKLAEFESWCGRTGRVVK